MNISAFDLSLRATGWASLVGGEITTGRIRPKAKFAKTPLKRLQLIRYEVAVVAFDADLVVLEDYAYSRTNRSHQMGELGGVIRTHLALAMERKVVLVSPTALKKFATGKGNAKKDLVLVEAVRRLGYDGCDHNESDALWLLHMAMCKYGLLGDVILPKARRETIDKVNWEGLT